MSQQETDPQQSVLQNISSQLFPDTYDGNQDLMDYAYDRVGYERPTNNTIFDMGASGQTMTPKTPVTADGYHSKEDEIIDRMFQRSLSEKYVAETDWRPGFERGFYGSEGLGDNIGTAIAVYGSYGLNKIGWDSGARFLATDWQSGLIGNSTRGGLLGMYSDLVSPEELYGDNWKDATPDEMLEHYRKWRAEDIEKWYGHIPAGSTAEALGWFAGQVIDVSSLAPTGAGFTAARLAPTLGKLGAGVAAGAVTGAPLAMAEQYMYGHIIENDRDPEHLVAAGLFGGLAGGILGGIGVGLNRLVARWRESKMPVKPSDWDEIKSTSLDESKAIRNSLDLEPEPKDEAAAIKLNQLKEAYDERIALLSKTDGQEMAEKTNDGLKAGKATDDANVVDAAMRSHSNKVDEDIEFTRMADRKNRKNPEDSLEAKKTSPVKEGMSDYEQQVTDAYIDARQGKKPKKTVPDPENKGKSDQQIFEEAIETKTKEINDAATQKLAMIRSLSPDFRINIARNTTSAVAGFGAGYVSGAAITNDPDVALMSGLSVGAIAMGSPIARKLYGGFTRAADLNSPIKDVRVNAIGEQKASMLKSFLHGNFYWQSPGWGSMPINQWLRRGGISKMYAQEHLDAEALYKYKFSNDMVRYGNMALRNGMSKDDMHTVGKLLDGTMKDTADGITERHIAARNELRAMYNRKLDDMVEVGAITKTHAEDLRKNGMTKGYMNRIYLTEYLMTPEGQEKFAEALMTAGKRKEGANVKSALSEKQAVEIIRAITGQTQQEANNSLKHAMTKDGSGYYTFTKDGIKQLMKNRKGPVFQPSSFIERARTLPDELQYALRPFLVTDPRIAFMKYAESANKRYAYAKHFGVNGEKAAAYGKLIADEWGDDRLKVLAVQDYQGAIFDPRNPHIDAFLNQDQFFQHANGPMQHWQNMKLMRSAPLNFTQHLIYAPALMAKYGYGPAKIMNTMFKSYQASFKEVLDEASRRGADGANFINRTGAMVDQLNYSATGELAAAQPNPKLGPISGAIRRPDFWLRATGFTKAEKWNRRVASFAGKFIVEDSIERKAYLEGLSRLSTGKQDELKEIKRLLLDLGIDPEVNPAKLTVEELENAGEVAGHVLMDKGAPFNQAKEMAGQRLSNMTNFQSDYMHKPRLWNHPYGQWFGKFRNFLLHGNTFINNNVIKPLGEGNGLPLATFLMAGTPLGMGVNEIREWLDNDSVDHSGFKGMLEGQMAVGGLGLWTESIAQAAQNDRNFLDFIMGPVFQDARKLVDTMVQNGPALDFPAIGQDLVKSSGLARAVAGPASKALGEPNPLATAGTKALEEEYKTYGLYKNSESLFPKQSNSYWND